VYRVFGRKGGRIRSILVILLGNSGARGRVDIEGELAKTIASNIGR
jgi:hypothetical protein